MNLIKKALLFILIGVSLGQSSQAQITSSKTANPKTSTSKNTQIKNITPPINFTAEDIEKIKTLVEHHLKMQLNDAQFAMYAKPTKENLALYQKINASQKNDPFFSQPHITFIVESMKERLGTDKPLRKSNIRQAANAKRNPKVSKIPKGTKDNF